MKIAIINGPNINMLGRREPGLYGNFTLDDLEQQLRQQAEGDELVFFQSNSEAGLIEYIHKLEDCDAAIINAAAFTHTSVALRDALLSVKLRFIEVHISNVYKRETFRHRSFLSDIAEGVIAGLGMHSYTLALEYLRQNQEQKK